MTNRPHHLHRTWLPMYVLLVVFLSSSLAHAASATFSWLPNTEPDLAGYKIYYGLSTGDYTTHVDVGLPPTENGRVHATISGLTPGTTYYFAATAYNADDLESDYSTEVVWTVPDDSNGNTVPVAAFTVSPNPGTASEAVTFDASPSSDADGDQLSYIWSFGDGTTLTTFSPQVTHTYSVANSYTVRLEVDDGTATSQASSTVLDILPVSSGGSDTSGPEAVIQANTAAGTAPLAVTFDGSSSSSSTAGSSIVQYAWSFGDGTTASGAIAQHTYTAAGSYTVTLVVTDTNAQQGQATTTITVTAATTLPDDGDASGQTPPPGPTTSSAVQALLPVYKLLLLK